MCWMVSLPKGLDIEKDKFENAFANNTHGAGFAYAKDGELFTSKGFFKFEEFYAAYTAIGKEVPRIVHFRQSTGGAKNDVNCHPFVISKDICFSHNGTFSGFTPTTEESDTNLYNQTILRPLLEKDYTLIHKGHIQWLISTSVSKNKLLFLDKDGHVAIINPQEGHFDKVHPEIWYSGYAHTFILWKSSTTYHSNGAKTTTFNNNSRTPNQWDEGSVSSNPDEETYPEWLNRHLVAFFESRKPKTEDKAKTQPLALADKV